MKRDNPLTDGGTILLAFGALAFFPLMLDREMLITSWLGSMQQPVGLSAMVVGGILFAMGKLRDLRNASPVGDPTDAAAVTPNELRAPVPNDSAQPTDTPPA